jgi:hypothetical protein
MIGLDTSHSVEFPRHFQGDTKAEYRIDGVRVTKAVRFPSVFQTEEGQDKRQAQLEEWGVEMVDSVDAAVKHVDGILIEINDPALHLEYFQRVASCGLPVFLDKPLAGSLAEGKAIIDLARRCGTCFWSTSSLRYIPKLAAARRAVPEPTVCSVYGALGSAPAGSDIVWYGVHAAEMTVAAMGTGATHVRAVEDPKGVVAVVRYGTERRAIIEYNRGLSTYGGRLQAPQAVATFDSVGEPIYYNFLLVLRDFLRTGDIPVPWEQTLEIQAIHDAAERSLASGREEAVAAV